MDDLLVATYFLRSFDHPERELILRTTVPSGPSATLPSVRSVWAMAVPLEAEMTERFGIRFEPTQDSSD
jgi:NADH:ubiquinone oxidoreductase subunit C